MAETSLIMNLLAVDRTGGALEEVSGKLDTLTKGAKLLGEAFAAEQLFDWGKEMVESGEEAQSVINATQQTLANLGANAGVTADQIGEISDKMGAAAGVVGSDFQAAMNKALASAPIEAAFKAGTISADDFAQTLSDLSSKMTNGQNTAESLATASQSLSKALTDPATAAAGLKKQGILLSAAQIALIKSTEKANGVGAAQALIFQDISGAVQGMTEATVPESAKVAASFETLKERIGLALLPAMDALMQMVTQYVVPALTVLTGVLTKIFAFVDAHTTTFKILAGVIAAVVVPIMAVKTAIATMTAIGEAWEAVQGLMVAGFWALDAAIGVLTSPITLVILAIAALTAGFILAYKHSQTFRDIVHASIADVMAVVNGLKNAFSGLWSVVESVWNNISNAISSAFNAIRNAWNATGLGAILSTVGSFAGKIGSFFGSIPGLAAGGTVTSAGIAMVGESGPEILSLPAGATVTPLSSAAKAAAKTTSAHKATTAKSTSSKAKELVVYLEITPLGNDPLLQAIRKAVRIKGGNVQAVLGSAG